MPSSAASPRRVAKPRSLAISSSSVSVSVSVASCRVVVSVSSRSIPGSVSVSRHPAVSFVPGRSRPAFRLAPARTAHRLALWLLSALSLVSPPPAGAQPTATRTTIERVVAVVNGRPVLLSELRAFERVRGLAERAALEALVDERLMYVEAARLPQSEVLPEEERRAASDLVARRPELAELAADDLRRLVRRQITILKYVEFRFRPQLRVSDDEVRAAFAADPAAGDSFEAAKDGVRARLERRALDERVEAWVRELRSRAEVRYPGGAAPVP